MSLAKILLKNFKEKNFSLKQAYDSIPNKPKETIRARIYDNIGIYFEKVSRGIYKTIDQNCYLLEGSGRDLSFIDDNTIDCIITDHPWKDIKSNKGGSRNFTDSYNCFEYTEKDFLEKARVLKDGSFLVEILPSENENNYEYLYKIKLMAKKAGFLYYSKVPWKKGTFISNTGRKSKNTEDILIFSKGKARPLRLDVKKSNKSNKKQYMSGTNQMLPTIFDIQSVSNKNKIHQAEKPVELFEQIIEYVTKENEIIIDQFAGSGALGEAAIKKKRKCILIEILKENIKKISKRLNMIPLPI